MIMKNNMDKLNFVPNEEELYALAELINTMSGNKVIPDEIIAKIISSGLTTNVLNAVPCEVGLFYGEFGKKQYGKQDSIPDFIKDNFYVIYVPSFSVGIAYAIPKCNYRFDIWKPGDLFPDLPNSEDKEEKAILLTPIWGGYQVYEYKYSPQISGSNTPGNLIMRYCIDVNPGNGKEYWFSFEKKCDGSWIAHIIHMPDIGKGERRHHRTYFAETGYHNIDWCNPVYSLENIIKIAKKWADYDYESNLR